MKIILKKFRQDDRSSCRRAFTPKTMLLTAAALALALHITTVARPIGAAGRTAVSGSDQTAAWSGTQKLYEDDNLTVDDDLTDIFLDTEEIDSGISATYDGKLDIPANVRLDKLDFGTDFMPPLDTARVTSLFDYRVNPVTGRYVFHTGMDLGAAQGANIYAMKAGRVVRATYDSGYGNFVVLEHENGIRTLYAHCSKLKVSTGDTVQKGDVIALVGSTGNSTGPHLHLEFRKDNQRYDPEWVIGGIYH